MLHETLSQDTIIENENTQSEEYRMQSVGQPMKDYTETLYSKNTAPKKNKSSEKDEKKQPKRTSWENPATIEHNIDTMRQRKTEPSDTTLYTSDDINKKVDRLLTKKKTRL